MILEIFRTTINLTDFYDPSGFLIQHRACPQVSFIHRIIRILILSVRSCFPLSAVSFSAFAPALSEKGCRCYRGYRHHRCSNHVRFFNKNSAKAN